MNPRAIIFDLDGTIVETNAIWGRATHALLERCNISLNGQEKDAFAQRINGLATREICQLIKDMAQSDLSIEEMVQLKHTLAHHLYESGEGISFVTGFPEFHAQVAATHLKTGVATNAHETTLQMTNRLMGLSRFFGEHLYSIKEVNNRCKPHPAIYLHVAEKLGVPPSECVAIEDSAHGIAAAKAAGMYCIGINTGNDMRQLREADRVINTYQDLSPSLLKLS
jgi:beta-phosphoglucomutase